MLAIDGSVLEAPDGTGVERAAAGLARELSRQAPGGVVLYSRFPVVLPGAPDLIHRPLGGPRTLVLWRDLRLAPALRRDGVRVLLSPVAALPVRGSVPRVAVVHELPWLDRPGIEGRFREMRYRLRILAATRWARRILVPSESTRRDLLRLAPAADSRVRVVPWGIDPQFATPADPGAVASLRKRLRLPPGPLLLFTGKPRARKNLPALLDALARLRARRSPPPSLVLAGVSAESVGGEGVFPLGRVREEDLPVLLDLADVFVFPSLSEGFGFPPLESMARGTPVVAGRAGSLPEVLGDAALLVDPSDPAALADAVERVLSDDDLRLDLAERGRRRAAEFSWATTGERALCVLREATR